MGFAKGEEAQGSTNCGILPSRRGEHGKHGEYGEQRKDGKHEPDDLKHSIYMTQNTISINQIAQTLFFMAPVKTRPSVMEVSP